MKLLSAMLLALLIATAAFADETTNKTETQASSFWNKGPRPYTQTFGVEAGPYHPVALALTNSNAAYEYTGSSLDSYLVEPNWAVELFHVAAGSVYFKEGMPFSMFKAAMPDSSGDLSLFLIGADTRIKYAAEWFPLRAFIPFAEGGYQYVFFSQSGPSELDTAQGSIGNFVAGAGFDLWINALFGKSHDPADRYNSAPFFLTAKVNRILGRNSSIDLGATNYFAGLSVGI